MRVPPRGASRLEDVYAAGQRVLRARALAGDVAILCDTPYKIGEHAHVTFDEFVKALTDAVGPALVKAIKAGKVVLAGGAVLALLMHGRIPADADFDLFVVDKEMVTEEAFRALLCELYSAIRAGPDGAGTRVWRSPNCVELKAGDRKYQVIRRIEGSLSGLVCAFDIPCCKFVLTANENSELVVLATSDALEALETRLNMTHMFLRSS